MDERGLPNTCVVDIMLHDDDSIYFLTARGKAFYERLAQNKFAAVSGMKGRWRQLCKRLSGRSRH